jgi:hypothetical protein
LTTRNGRNQRMQSLHRFVSWCQGVLSFSHDGTKIYTVWYWINHRIRLFFKLVFLYSRIVACNWLAPNGAVWMRSLLSGGTNMERTQLYLYPVDDTGGNELNESRCSSHYLTR